MPVDHLPDFGLARVKFIQHKSGQLLEKFVDELALCMRQVRDGRNGCYAFVTFESAGSANTAIQKGAVVQGKRVYVEPRYPRQEADPPHSIPSVPVPLPVSVAPTAPRSGIPSAPRNVA